ncbi:VOC family protein [Vibrio tapetis]|nr:VOC family protein [Vibrio tapetis]
MLNSLERAELAPKQMIERLPTFMAKVTQLLDRLDVDLTSVQADHLAMRINEQELAENAHKVWQEHGRVISDAQINGRSIIVLEFNEPLIASTWAVECLELPYPAPGKIYPHQDWEHIEFVIPSNAETAEAYFADIKQKFPTLSQALERHPEIDVKLSSPKGDGERLNNPTVAFKHQGICIKLHPHPLKAIVESEQG